MPVPETSDDLLVRCRKLRKVYGQTVALDGVSFDLRRGEILGLLGPNGAGKTTAIHTVLGLLAPTSGDVSVFGRSPLRERHRIAEQLNFASAYVELPGNLKVDEVLKIFALLYGVRRPRAAIDELLERFAVAPLHNRLVGALSSGERTRLALVKCLLNDPLLLLLDEPTASLDPEMADTVRRALREIQRERRLGILYTSHNMPEVEQMCDRILFLHRGRRIAEGSPEEILKSFDSKTLEQVFIKIVRSGDLVEQKG